MMAAGAPKASTSASRRGLSAVRCESTVSRGVGAVAKGSHAAGPIAQVDLVETHQLVESFHHNFPERQGKEIVADESDVEKISCDRFDPAAEERRAHGDEVAGSEGKHVDDGRR